MANILLTTTCNRSCPYCFAQREMSDSKDGSMMSWENLLYIADFFHASGQRGVSLLGGEPTIHPEFVEFVLYLLERSFDITVFTNGMLSESRLEEFKHHFADVPPERLNFVCNLNDPLQTSPSIGESERVHRFLSAMGPWTSAGFNIYRTDFTLDFLFDLINRYGMKRHLRLGIAHPVPGKRNDFIHPKDMRQVIERFCSYAAKFDAFRVKPGLDCGFPICQFSNDELGWLHRFGPSYFSCGAAFDIGPDMSVYHCFPLGNYRRRSLFEFDSMQQVEQHFAQLCYEIKAEIPGIFAECDRCKYQEDGVCSGGGMCQVVNHFVGEAPVRIPEIEDEVAKIRLSK